MNSPDALFRLSSYDYELPEELIAQHPCSPRDHSRLMIVERATGNLSEIKFYELQDFLNPQDRLIFNNTKVMRARLQGKRRGGGISEVFLVKRLLDDTWEVLAKPAKKLPVGATVTFEEGVFCEVIEELPEGVRRVQFNKKFEEFDLFLKTQGRIPLPHYIRGGQAASEDDSCYQTIFAELTGAAAAPTAGLHFTENLLEKCKAKNIEQIMVTLHVGLGTFRPVQTADIRDHKMHVEPFMITQEAAKLLNKHREGSQEVCVGTTCCRTLESAADESGFIQGGAADTQAFIYPGYRFKYVKTLLTNFHAPQSSLLMLVSAFAGYELIQEAYRKAVLERYRFFSYGDAMLIL